MLISSPQEMFELWSSYALSHKVILLHGELGAGKTHFTQGFASGLGIDSKKVQSPTYTYINIYDEKLLHIDMYRLQSSEDFITKGILDQLQHYEYIIIERPKFTEYYQDIIGITLHIEKISSTQRTIHVL